MEAITETISPQEVHEYGELMREDTDYVTHVLPIPEIVDVVIYGVVDAHVPVSMVSDQVVRCALCAGLWPCPPYSNAERVVTRWVVHQ